MNDDDQPLPDHPRPPTPHATGHDTSSDDVTAFDDSLDDLDPRLAALFTRAFATPVEVEVAARHLWSIDREGTRLTTERAQPRGLRRVLVTGLAALALMTTSSAAVAASGPSLPGDLLYPVKIGAEQARLTLARGPESEALVLLDIASRRLADAQRAATERPEAVDGLLAEAASALSAAGAVPDASPGVTEAAEQVRRTAAQTASALAPELGPQGRQSLGEVTAAVPQPAPPAAPPGPAGPPPGPGGPPVTEASPSSEPVPGSRPPATAPAAPPGPSAPPPQAAPPPPPPAAGVAPPETTVPSTPETATAGDPEQPVPPARPETTTPRAPEASPTPGAAGVVPPPLPASPAPPVRPDSLDPAPVPGESPAPPPGGVLESHDGEAAGPSPSPSASALAPLPTPAG